ncbi:MAG: tRNA pseudouridine(13) synthase TruD [Candidatus Verstraetearchaeota archaeon]|nr:tRNA pseudouridine(13) synthase TruD [Candidatus Verstraetearchaeota archaeon]
MQLPKTRSKLEAELGMVYYSEERIPLAGRLRQTPEDFVVEEISPEGELVNLDLEALDRGSGGFTLAVLSKRSRDLMPVISLLEKRLGARVGYAGIKDRVALTSQLISVGRDPSSWDPPTDIPGVKIKVVGQSRYPVVPGDLLGNRFTITARSIPPGSATERALSPPDWIPNYFGHQRFGTSRPNTHRVGRLLLKGDFEGAVREFLASPYPSEPEDTRRARIELRETWDLRRALISFPKSLHYERAVIRRLIDRPGDYEGALSALPTELCRLFVNAYQSYLFNLALSHRLETAGPFGVLEGDIVSPLDRSNLPSRPLLCTPSNREKLQRWVASRRAVIMLQVPGWRTRLSGPEGLVYGHLFEEDGLQQSSFRGVLGLHFEGTLRAAAVSPSGFTVLSRGQDELNPGAEMVTVRFALPKGSFATLVMREMMRPEDPAVAGF